MKIGRAPLRLSKYLPALLGACALLFFCGGQTAAQSIDIDYPTPVRSNEISGAIAPRDLGDSRLTRYYYSFTGTPGDLIVIVESRNLEGDVDVFTSGALRPLAKVSMYAASAISGGAKTIYLRNRESLILRVEARTPNDDNGVFRIRFEGSFEPVSSNVPDPEPVIPMVSSAGSTNKRGRKVTATGARIEEPEPEVTETKQPETTNATTPTTATETTAPATEAPKPIVLKPTVARNRRPRTPTSSTRTPRRRQPTTAKKSPPPAEASSAPASPPAVEPAAGPRLIIETRDGMRLERFMTTVRRVTVENGQLVVITKEGRIERHPMSEVLRMAIEP